MKNVKSSERSTGMGATHYTAVLLNGEFVRVSDVPDARHLGRNSGYNEYEVAVADDAITAEFYRSNSGKMEVTASNGMEWASFQEAQRWAKGKSAPVTCKCCGREL